MMLYALVAVCALSGILCDESMKQNCLRTQEHFNFSKLVGRWHLAQLQLESAPIRNVSDEEENPVLCVMVDIQLDKDKSKKLTLSITLEGSTEQERWNLTGTMVVSDDSTNPAKLYLGNLSSPFDIVETDYQTYVIISRCHEEISFLSGLFDGVVVLVKNMGSVEDSLLRASRVAEEQDIRRYVPAYKAPAKCALI